MAQPIRMRFGSSGVRQVVTPLFLEGVYRLGLSLGNDYPKVIIGGDTRTSTPALKHAFLAGLMAMGVQVSDAGVLPTPTLAFAARRFNAGAIVTGSHNPPEYNGVKLWNPDGSAFDDAQRERIERLSARPSACLSTSWERMTDCFTYPTAIEEHLERVLSDFPGRLGLKVAVDAGGGAASHVTSRLLREMGCQVVSLNCQPTGFFPRPSEPTSESLGTLTEVVKAVGADLGLAHDGDSDRLVAVDDRGEVVPGDKMLVLLARSVGATKVVTTVDASMALEDAGFKVLRTRVGDAFVSQELKSGGDFGGEPSGAWIFPRVSFCPDGIYAAAAAARLASQEKLSQQADSIPVYRMLRDSFPVPRAGSPTGLELFNRIEDGLMQLRPDATARLDGLRLDFGDAWLLVRPSGTEPKVRLTVEARTQTRARSLFVAATNTIRSCLDKAGSGVDQK